MSLLASRRCVRAAAESNQPRRCRALSRSSEHIPSAAHTMTARAITTHARAVLVLASCAALLPAVQSLPTRAPTAKPTAFMPLPPLPTLAPSSSPAAGSDDGMSSSTSPTAYRDLNPPRPTYADRDALEPLSFPPTVPPSSIATEDEDEEHTAECPNRERGCEECSLNGDKWKISSYLTCPNRQSCHGIRDDEVPACRIDQGGVASRRRRFVDR